MPFRNFDVIPLHQNEKRPLGDDWLNRKWTREELEWHEFIGHNMGVRLRKIDLIVDFDIKNLDPGIDPEMFVFEFLMDFGIANALTIRTASGGYHVYLKKDPTLQIKRYLKEYGKAVEFKTFGTQVVAPGSRINGREYTVETDGPQMQVPEALAAMLRKDLSGGTGQEVLSSEAIKKLLDKLPAEDCQDYDTWLRIGQAIHSGTDGSDEGLELFAEWSGQDPKYGEAGAEAARQKWSTFTAGGSINIHYIKKVMKDLGIELPRPSAADDFADISLDFIPEIDTPNKPEFVSNYKEVGGNGLSEAQKERILGKYLSKLEESESDFQSRIGGMTEKQMQKAIAQREGKIKKLIAKAEAEIEKKHEKALQVQIEPLTPTEIFSTLKDAMQGREWGIYGERIAVLSEDGETVSRYTPESLVNVLDAVGVGQKWKGACSTGDYLVSRKDFANYLVEERRHGKIVDSITDVPSWPLRKNSIYYGPARRWVLEEATVRGKLDQFLDFFRFAPGFNRQLGKAFFLTLLWGETGRKPGFAILSTAKSIKDKKKTGKSRFVYYMNQMAASLPGTKLIHQGANAEAFSRQIPNLLKSSSRRPNLFILENFDENSVIPNDFNEWAESDSITGRAIHEATAEVTNDFTFALTSNAPSLTADLSDRFLPIFLDPPSEDPQAWQERIEAFIRENREDVVKEAIEILKQEKTQHVKFCRFTDWQSQILGNIVSEEQWAKLGSAVSLHKQAAAAEMNRDIEIFEDFDEFMLDMLAKVNLSPDTFSKLGLKVSFVKNMAKNFALQNKEKGVRHEYIMQNLSTYSKLLVRLESLTRGPNSIKTSGAVYFMKGEGDRVRHLTMRTITPQDLRFGANHAVDLDQDYFY